MSVAFYSGCVILLGLVFTYTNGFQDGSSVAASAIACRALSPIQVVMLVATCEFAGAILGGSAVANTIQSITSFPAGADLLPVLACGLLAAIVWNYATKFLRVPSSSTHALVGGILGAVVSATGSVRYLVMGNPDSLVHSTGIWKVIISLVASPLIGFSLGYLFLVLATLLLMHATTRVNKILTLLQWLTTAALAFGHGANDTQKIMGILLLSFQAQGVSYSNGVPMFIRLLTGVVMSIGVCCMAPGIMKSVGAGIYKLRPVHGFVIQLASALVVVWGSLTGGPVSSSQVVASAVMGTGTAQRRKGVHWLVARDMLIAWLLTIPCSALLAFLIYAALFHSQVG